jgi:predicted pyridoxine 5'-phosphate oxidase superfamily flavin-nucleotide-binding protein
MAAVYHPGELSVQARAEVREMADRIGRSIRSTIPLAAQEFLRSQPMAIVGSVDASRRVWASLLTDDPGFIQPADEQTVRINSRPAAGDPLCDNLTANDQVGLVVIEFATRRRMRLNGRAEMASDGAIYVHAQQVYSNCPKYIQARGWEKRRGDTGLTAKVQRQSGLTEEQQRWIHQADTFFVASHHREGGADASHRGGSPGFVRALNANRLIWPDYSGNTMFQTLGNIAANPHAGLLFIDFESGGTLQLTGKARIIWDRERTAEFAGAERLIELDVEAAIVIAGASPLEWRFIGRSPFNPA